MIYHYNNIFMTSGHVERAVSKYLKDIRLDFYVSDTTVVTACPSLRVSIDSLNLGVDKLELSITGEFFRNITGPAIKIKSTISAGELRGDTVNTLTSNDVVLEDAPDSDARLVGASIVYQPPESQVNYTDLNLDIKPSAVTLFQQSGDSRLTIPSKDIDVTISDGMIALAIDTTQTYALNDINADAIKFINGISPGISGNIDIVPMSTGISVVVCGEVVDEETAPNE